MNIVLVCAAPSGGHPLYIAEVAAALARLPEDIRVEVLAPANLEDRFRSTVYPIRDILPADPVRRHENVLIWRLKLARYWIKLDRACIGWLRRRPETAILHFQSLFWLSAPQMHSYRRLGVSLVNTIHNLKPHRYSGVMPPRLEDAISYWMLRQCEGLFVHTEGLRCEAAKLLGPRHPPIFVTPHGLFHSALPSDLAALRERLSWKKMLLFGSIRRNKGPHVALEALKKLEGFHLTIAGQQNEPTYWRECVEPLLAEVRGMGRSVEVIDRFVSDEEAAALFAGHSFALLPYTRDFHSQSGVLHLAIGLDTPVVSTAVGGLAETVSPWDVGEIAPPESPEALVAAVHRLCGRNPDVLGKKLQEAREGLSWDHTARITVDAYRKIRAARHKQ